ncbi:IclR family transcriptional regulator [Streptomyces pathocidini]|uniref:IclR family transcriptional regulator n=1 Tax=Streptomyces pathocidini TaxID=1650571 RepID=A0ABW7UK50_9ACTN|nr:IclR family transcriptional regulator [Streptomyces pathocidini]
MQNKPAYAIASVDKALHLAQLLQQEGALRVTDAAERLGLARSTVHRLLAMLVHRGFAERDEHRRYLPGPLLRPAPRPADAIPSTGITALRRAALPHLRTLVSRTGETATVQVRAGAQTRFVATVECRRVLRVGDRDGRALPAHLTSGGKALLAALAPWELAEVYPGSRPPEAPYGPGPDFDPARLRRELALVRERGFALNDQRTEPGLTALGVLVREPGGAPYAAVCLALPSVRFHRDRLPEWVRELARTAALVERELARG